MRLRILEEGHTAEQKQQFQQMVERGGRVGDMTKLLSLSPGFFRRGVFELGGRGAASAIGALDAGRARAFCRVCLAAEFLRLLNDGSQRGRAGGNERCSAG